MNDLQRQTERLIRNQIENWELARRNYSALKNISTKRLDFDGFSIMVQFNPERVRSTTASTDTITRPCFLCARSRHEQQSVVWKNYEILLNPYPIFSLHLTVPHKEHIDQHLTGHLSEMIELSAELMDFIITFNGSRSGASAPDHFHFQAVPKGVLPAEEIPGWNSRTPLFFHKNIDVWGVDGYLRPAVVVEGTSLADTITAAEKTFSCLTSVTHSKDEAQVNALAWVADGIYRVVFFIRTDLRPAQYYAEGEEQFLFSPGVMDMAGVVITVRKNDFERATPELLTDMISQVVPNAEQWRQIKTDLRTCLQKSLK